MKQITEIIQFIKETIEEVSLGNLKSGDIQDSDKLLELGLDSLDFATVMLSTEGFIGFKVDENNINWRQVATVQQLAELLWTCQK